jgi:hypothetical protein
MELNLTDLKPSFIRHEYKMDTFKVHEDGEIKEVTRPVSLIHKVDSIEEAQGIQFLCPVCFTKNGGDKGTHRVMCWSRSRGTPEEIGPRPGRWTLEGTGYHDLTLNGDNPAVPGGGARSVLLMGGCGWHGFVTNGKVT